MREAVPLRQRGKPDRASRHERVNRSVALSYRRPQPEMKILSWQPEPRARLRAGGGGLACEPRGISVKHRGRLSTRRNRGQDFAGQAAVKPVRTSHESPASQIPIVWTIPQHARLLLQRRDGLAGSRTEPNSPLQSESRLTTKGVLTLSKRCRARRSIGPQRNLAIEHRLPDPLPARSQSSR